MTTLQTMIDALLGRVRVTVSEEERAVVLIKGRFAAILGPGEHALVAERKDLVVDRMGLPTVFADDGRIGVLRRARPDLFEAHFERLETGENEVGLLTLDGRVKAIVTPATGRIVLRAAGDWAMERIALTGGLEVPTALARRLNRETESAVLSNATTTASVPAGFEGVMFVDGVCERTLKPGAYMFLRAGPIVAVRYVDMRAQALDLTGQEILTRDRVSIRVNVSVAYRVADAALAGSASVDHEAELRRSAALAVRATLGARTLDQILEEKVSVDEGAAAALRERMATLGLEVGEIALKDVILPGEMRTILNRVVEAEKEAQANVIRRREETAATRSLLNTAKIMAENPIMLRLKELEALETISSRVDQLVVHNGPKGLLGDIARLRDES